MATNAFSSDLSAPDDIARQLIDCLPAFQEVSWIDVTGSTNSDLLERVRKDRRREKPWLLGTHHQKQGRGRAGRPWQDRPGATLMFSCAFDIHLPAVELPTLSLVAGLIACEALRQSAGPQATGLCIKWPNDVQWHDSKLAGVLVETLRNPGTPSGYSVIIGIGINLCDAAHLSQTFDRPISDWTQVCAGAPRSASTIDLVCAVATAWHDAICQLEIRGFSAFCARFEKLDALIGRPVNVVDQGAVLFSGTARGVDSQGRLLLQTHSGLTPVCVGKISVHLQA